MMVYESYDVTTNTAISSESYKQTASWFDKIDFKST